MPPDQNNNLNQNVNQNQATGGSATVNVIGGGGDGGGGGFVAGGGGGGTIGSPAAIAPAPQGASFIIGPPQGSCAYNAASGGYYDAAGNPCVTNGMDWGAQGTASGSNAVILSAAQGSCGFNRNTGTYQDANGNVCWSDGKYWWTQ